MKAKLFITTLLFSISLYSFAQECPENPEEVPYKKAMSSAFAKEYEKCPILIKGEYLQDGYLTGYRKPSKIKDMYFFQCVAEGEKGSSQPFQSGLTGEFFVIDKKKADKVLSLKKGDRIELIGTTFTQNYFGTEINTFFIVTDVKKIE